MRVFVAGATGALGQRLLVLLKARGHDVTALSQSPETAAEARAMGAEPVLARAFDRDALARLIGKARPEVVIHLIASLRGLGNPRRFGEELAETNRLRTEGTDHLVRAATDAGARRFIAQSVTNWPNSRDGAPVQGEDDRLDSSPPAAQRQSLEAIRYLERRVADAPGIDGVVLRYGNLYGRGTAFASDGAIARDVRERRFPLVGDSAGIWSFVHVRDAVRATVLALAKGRPGIYNITDDEPAPVSRWLPELATALSAPPPRRLPSWLAFLQLGAAGVSMMTRIRGSSNGKAKRELEWSLTYPTWRFGFRRELCTVRRRRDAPRPGNRSLP